MPRASRAKETLPIAVLDQLQKMGMEIGIARKRRHISVTEMAERMNVNFKTVQRLESGDPAVGIGIVTTALWVLGMHRRLGDLVSPSTDQAGLQEEIGRLPRDFRKTQLANDKFDF